MYNNCISTQYRVDNNNLKSTQEHIEYVYKYIDGEYTEVERFILGTSSMSLNFQQPALAVIDRFRNRCLASPYAMSSQKNYEEVERLFNHIFTSLELAPMQSNSMTMSDLYEFIRLRSPGCLHLLCSLTHIGHAVELTYGNSQLIEDVLIFLNVFNLLFISGDENCGGLIRIRVDQIEKYTMWRDFCILVDLDKNLYPEYKRHANGDYSMYVYDANTKTWSDRGEYMIVYNDDGEIVYKGKTQSILLFKYREYIILYIIYMYIIYSYVGGKSSPNSFI